MCENDGGGDGGEGSGIVESGNRKVSGRECGRCESNVDGRVKYVGGGGMK